MQCSDAKRKIQLEDNFKKVILPTISQSSEKLKKKRMKQSGKKKKKTIKHSSTSYYFKNSIFNKLPNILKQK